MTDSEAATVVQIGEADELRDVDIRLRQIARRVKISGRLLFLDGSPVANEAIVFHTRGKEFRTYSAADGSFSLVILAGEPGEIVGELLLSRNCQLGKNLGKRGDSLTTPPAPVSGLADQDGIVLTFPFNRCTDRR